MQAKHNHSEAFRTAFSVDKPILGMLHLMGDSDRDVFDRAKREIDLLFENGVDAVVVENYFGTPDQMAQVLAYLQAQRPIPIYGVNVLDDDEKGFAYAARYGASFLQLDSVAGHLPPDEDARFAETLAAWRASTSAVLLGGVRFKYQPVLSGRSVEEDLRLGMERCDAIVVTGEGTGMDTPIEKIEAFRVVIGDFPLIVGAGTTPASCAEQLAIADGAIVGSYFKRAHQAKDEIEASHVRAYMEVARQVRAGSRS